MMEETTIISVIETEEGLKVKINEMAYGNIAIVGVIEKIKFSLLNNEYDEVTKINTNQKYDA